jgi:hypothetical protein
MKSLNPETYFGMKFGERTVLDQWKTGNAGNKFFLCRCDAGHESWVKLAHLNAGTGSVCKTCHCRRIATRHGQARPGKETPTYIKWSSMRSRVKNDPSYLKRGIKVCDRWSVFENFIEDMGEAPHPSMEIDRVKGNGDYCPKNCEWKTRIQNNRNRQNLRFVAFAGMNMCVSDWEKYLNVGPDVLRKKLRFKRPLEKVMAELGFRVDKLPFLP